MFTCLSPKWESWFAFEQLFLLILALLKVWFGGLKLPESSLQLYFLTLSATTRERRNTLVQPGAVVRLY